MSSKETLLTINNVRKFYGDNEVLRGVSMSVAKGETVAVLGASGSGKSTLLRCVNCLEIPDGGAIRLRGDLIGFETRNSRVQRLSERQLARQRADIGMVFQNFNLFPHWTVLKNVIQAPIAIRNMPKAEARDLGTQLLERVGLADRADSYPRQLSGGQQQRVAIARALAMRPQVILFDEPTSALDPANVGEVTGVMQDLAREGTTMVVVTHEIGFASQAADRIVFIHQGTVLEDGPAQQVLHEPRHEVTRDFLRRTTDH